MKQGMHQRTHPQFKHLYLCEHTCTCTHTQAQINNKGTHLVQSCIWHKKHGVIFLRIHAYRYFYPYKMWYRRTKLIQVQQPDLETKNQRHSIKEAKYSK